jgi:DNA-binding CsgD family transcriptional regulator
MVLSLAWSGRWRFAPVLFIPAGVFTGLGLVFLLNVASGDWQSWAYAWLLAVSGLGLGGALAANRTPLPDPTWLVSIIIALAGLALFGVFGAIAGGMFIRIAAPLLLMAGGLGLRFGWFKALLPEGRVRVDTVKPAALPEDHQNKPAALVEPLTTREIEVLGLIDQGLTNQEIANRLTLAPSTVKTHINNLYGKLDVQTRVQAIKKARDLRIL